MNKYFLKLHGGLSLGEWSMRYTDMDLRGVKWFCESQLNILVNINRIDIFNDDGPMAYIGSVERVDTYKLKTV